MNIVILISIGIVLLIMFVWFLKCNKESKRSQKCSLCNNKATHFSSPFPNRDEPALCDIHFEELLSRQNDNG